MMQLEKKTWRKYSVLSLPLYTWRHFRSRCWSDCTQVTRQYQDTYWSSDFLSGTIFPFVILFNMGGTWRLKCFYVELELNHYTDSWFLEYGVDNKMQPFYVRVMWVKRPFSHVSRLYNMEGNMWYLLFTTFSLTGFQNNIQYFGPQHKELI